MRTGYIYRLNENTKDEKTDKAWLCTSIRQEDGKYVYDGYTSADNDKTENAVIYIDYDTKFCFNENHAKKLTAEELNNDYYFAGKLSIETVKKVFEKRNEFEYNWAVARSILNDRCLAGSICISHTNEREYAIVINTTDTIVTFYSVKTTGKVNDNNFDFSFKICFLSRVSFNQQYKVIDGLKYSDLLFIKNFKSLLEFPHTCILSMLDDHKLGNIREAIERKEFAYDVTDEEKERILAVAL